MSCGDVVIDQGSYKFVSCRNDDRLEIYKADNSLLGTIHGPRLPLGVCLDQSGYIYVAAFEGNEVYKY